MHAIANAVVSNVCSFGNSSIHVPSLLTEERLLIAYSVAASMNRIIRSASIFNLSTPFYISQICKLNRMKNNALAGYCQEVLVVA